MGEKKWSGQWDSNPQLPAWEAGTLPLSYARSQGPWILTQTLDISKVRPYNPGENARKGRNADVR